jgi:hypothetical protein
MSTCSQITFAAWHYSLIKLPDIAIKFFPFYTVIDKLPASGTGEADEFYI